MKNSIQGKGLGDPLISWNFQESWSWKKETRCQRLETKESQILRGEPNKTSGTLSLSRDTTSRQDLTDTDCSLSRCHVYCLVAAGRPVSYWKGGPHGQVTLPNWKVQIYQLPSTLLCRCCDPIKNHLKVNLQGQWVRGQWIQSTCPNAQEESQEERVGGIQWGTLSILINCWWTGSSFCTWLSGMEIN